MKIEINKKFILLNYISNVSKSPLKLDLKKSKKWKEKPTERRAKPEITKRSSLSLGVLTQEVAGHGESRRLLPLLCHCSIRHGIILTGRAPDHRSLSSLFCSSFFLFLFTVVCSPFSLGLSFIISLSLSGERGFRPRDSRREILYY